MEISQEELCRFFYEMHYRHNTMATRKLNPRQNYTTIEIIHTMSDKTTKQQNYSTKKVCHNKTELRHPTSNTNYSTTYISDNTKNYYNTTNYNRTKHKYTLIQWK